MKNLYHFVVAFFVIILTTSCATKENGYNYQALQANEVPATIQYTNNPNGGDFIVKVIEINNRPMHDFRKMYLRPENVISDGILENKIKLAPMPTLLKLFLDQNGIRGIVDAKIDVKSGEQYSLFFEPNLVQIKDNAGNIAWQAKVGISTQYYSVPISVPSGR